MANGGNSGRELDRLQDQVDATRTELAEMAAAIGGLTELVTDLVRRSAPTTDHQGDRWQARLGSLETRLEMLETAIRGEVERIRAAVGSVDASADDFRATVGQTHTLVELAEQLGGRLSSLQSLERQVRGAAQDVASTVETRLAEDARDRESREQAVLDRVAAIFERIDELKDPRQQAELADAV